MASEAPSLQDGAHLIEAYLATADHSLPLVGIAGGSASGKTTLAAMVQSHFRTICGVLHSDDYYHDRSLDNHDEPAAFDLDLLTDHLQALSAEETIHVPRYDFTLGRRSGTTPFGPYGLIVVEGLYPLQSPVRDYLTLKVFVDAPAEIRLARRVTRDVAERGRTPASVHAKWTQTVAPMHDQHVAFQREVADIVVNNP